MSNVPTFHCLEQRFQLKSLFEIKKENQNQKNVIHVYVYKNDRLANFSLLFKLTGMF